ncbi:MAG: hypothetical protein ACOCQR_01990 [bacterium]
MHITFRVNEEKDEDIVEYIEHMHYRMDTNNRTKVIKEIFRQAMSYSNLDLNVEKLLKQQEEIREKLENMKTVQTGERKQEGIDEVNEQVEEMSGDVMDLLTNAMNNPQI